MSKLEKQENENKLKVSVTIDPANVNGVDKIAKLEKRSRSNVVDIAVEEYIDKWEEEKEKERERKRKEKEKQEK